MGEDCEAVPAWRQIRRSSEIQLVIYMEKQYTYILLITVLTLYTLNS